ncbi:hypothetical protein [Mycolicibacterium mageritense]|uniref:hypothetical protein n=1 Tax=Mycolicibacterium mageritense TaxID=53462 RepID=UPI00115403D1|nr:hypothetical protein [Mycolicibacterium mageritense]TXI56598.1 MAG: hypothetical protein E6Q55_28485 [Mycolicibacterium mageritense]
MRLGTRWPSLSDQIDVAAALYGDHGDALVDEWFAEQTDRVGNLTFGRTFSDHITLPGIEPADYSHRRIRSSRGDLIGGIRFYSRDVTRPFVEVAAHSFDDVAALGDCVAAEWAAFRPPYLRLRTRPGRLTGPGVLLDVSIHVARYRDMTPPDGRVRLDRFNSADEAIDLVERRYAHVAGHQPALARNISAADSTDLRRWHDDGLLRAIRARDVSVGVLAIAPGAIGWITGDEINEEVIDAGHNGNGYAASAQTAWAVGVATDRARMLIGTIDRHNPASRNTAERAGRPRVLDDVFVSLRGPAQTH